MAVNWLLLLLSRVMSVCLCDRRCADAAPAVLSAAQSVATATRVQPMLRQKCMSEFPTTAHCIQFLLCIFSLLTVVSVRKVHIQNKTDTPLMASFPGQPSVLWRCWLGSRKGIRPVKSWRGYLFGASHIIQLMPLPVPPHHLLLQ